MNDTYEIIHCPACGKEMTKIFDEEHGINIDICLDGCGGIFFDNREFKLYDEKTESANIIKEALDGKAFEAVDETLTRVCPLCGNNMTKNYTSVNKEIQIDECYNCGAQFLDHNELKRIRDQYDTEEDRKNAFLSSVKSITNEIAQMDAENKLRYQKRSNFLKSLDNIFFR